MTSTPLRNVRPCFHQQRTAHSYVAPCVKAVEEFGPDLRTNAEGLLVGLLLTPGEAHDSTVYPDLMAEHGTDPEVMLSDRGYDSNAIRDDIRARGGMPEIPTKKSRRVQHSVNRALYALRNASSGLSIG